MAASIRQQILEALADRLRVIRQSGGFQTDLGAKVYLQELPDLGPDDPCPAVAIVVGDETPAEPGQQLKVFVALPFEVQVVARVDLDQPWVLVEAGITDAMQALELADRTLGGLAHQIESGPVRASVRVGNVAGASIGYTVTYARRWGHP